MKRTKEWWDDFFLLQSHYISTASKDPSTQVGCVLVDDERRIVGMGYNGFPRGVEDSDDRLNDREIKYLMVQHAEVNAVLNATTDIKNCTAYVTHKPCSSCTGVLIQAGVKRIVTTKPEQGLYARYEKSFKTSDIMLQESGVEIEYKEL